MQERAIRNNNMAFRPQIVVLDVAGSNPVAHPKFPNISQAAYLFFFLACARSYVA